ncbi:cytochrome c biogenesis protein CcmE [Haloarcula taiwanensis]|uniref:Cytochrome c biogenesis protein CcmE n=1 Tax=Haloarcula taiwanensis TaxID=1932004 RepID=A0A2H4ZZ78_9EURY|nr:MULTISPECIES: cytochrome c maturation protein CcmE [Haloarcula]AUG47737.1 cytochrome c biogenesis protein CcmE [Haloarcula taiwanensis]RLM39044.1 cytochrome c biogenesis protein CcmE [Haloarcula sp. Atlit-120R]RLM46989.1 cytochrome c biogenesis protein CcmE [Haloarcula sp. Atlit-47R]RLM90643.1 cytochrome c biogenesis protein CcmE [Haloarcula sp. Atlit-7R]
MQTKTRLLVGGVVIPVLFGAMAVTTMGGAAEFTTPTKITNTGEYDGDRVNLEGIAIDIEQTNERLSFAVTDGNASVPVVYEGPMPETMSAGRTVVAKGYYNGSAVEAESLSIRAHEGEHPSGHNNSTQYGSMNGTHANVTGYDKGAYGNASDGTNSERVAAPRRE